MPLPNFFVIGAAKSGTSALYHSLKQHPDIFMSPIKEPRFFAYEGEPPIVKGPGGTTFPLSVVWKEQEYMRLFDGVTTERAIGEATVAYLWTALAAQQIRQRLPDSKIIAILRQPADRAYSHYVYAFERGNDIAPTFSAALAEESAGLRSTWYYGLQHKAVSYYNKQLAAYYDLFPREQIKIYLYEDFTRRTDWMLHDLFRFLEVDMDFVPQVEKKNVTLVPKNRRFHLIARNNYWVERRLAPLAPRAARNAIFAGISRLNRKYNLARPEPLDPVLRQQLTEEFREDILQVQDLIGRDLSHWLQPAPE